jgi:superfamily II DNA or RNA helicase
MDQHKYVLRLQNVSSWLLTTDDSLKRKLARGLRARPKGFQHVEAFRKKLWDGWKPFFYAKNGCFLSGLRHEVESSLQILKRPYTIVDERTAVRWTNSEIGDQFINRWLPEDIDPITLHDFQPDLANKCFKYNRGIVQAPTGSGKTFILISLLHSLPPRTPTLFLTNRASLVHQNYLIMKKWGIQNVGRYYSKYKENNNIICATTNAKTLENLKDFLPKVKALFVDEVHDCVSDAPANAYRAMPNAAIRIGFSASPFRWHKKKIEKEHKLLVKGHFGNVFRTQTTESGLLTAKELQGRNILSPSEATVYKITSPDLAYEPYQDAVKMGIEENFDFHQIVQRLVKSLSGRTLVIVERIQQGVYLKQLLPEADWLYGDIKVEDRLPAIEGLRADEKRVTICMRHLITAGIDVKIHNLVNASGGEAAHNLIQQIGRGLRTASDKDTLKYYDFLFLINDYLRKHSEWRIEVLKQEGHPVTVMDDYDF